MENNAEAQSENEISAVPSNPPSTSTSKSKPATYEVMVKTAITYLGERNGSTVQAIKKYIAANYNIIDITKSNVYIKNYIKRATIKGDLIQTKGTGATGSFKLPKEMPKKTKTKLGPKLSAALKIPVSKKASKVKANDENSKKQNNNKKTAAAKNSEKVKPKVIQESAPSSKKPKKIKDAGTKRVDEPKTKAATKEVKSKATNETKLTNEKKTKPVFKLNTSFEAIRKSLGAAKKASRRRAEQKQQG